MRLKGIQVSRRDVLARAAAAASAVSLSRLAANETSHDASVDIFDSHVHVWDLKQFHLPWLEQSMPVMRRDYSMADYVNAIAGLGVVSAAYIEVSVEAGQREREAEYLVELCRKNDNPIAVGVLGGDPREPGFREYIERFQDRPCIRGVRFLYPRGGSVDHDFIRGLQLLGERQLSFELQLGPPLLADAVRTVESCPQTHFVLNHCGGIEPRVFRADVENDSEARERRETWRRGIAAIAKRDNVVCKISGIADASLPGEATAQDLAPIVNFCLEQFGPDRVLFGGNWPVCLKASTLEHWVSALKQIIANRPAQERRKLFYENGVRVYRVDRPRKAAGAN